MKMNTDRFSLTVDEYLGMFGLLLLVGSQIDKLQSVPRCLLEWLTVALKRIKTLTSLSLPFLFTFQLKPMCSSISTMRSHSCLNIKRNTLSLVWSDILQNSKLLLFSYYWKLIIITLHIWIKYLLFVFWFYMLLHDPKCNIILQFYQCEEWKSCALQRIQLYQGHSS